jgi:hypothetical protein
MPKITKPPRSAEDDMRKRLRDIAKEATPEERQWVDDLIQLAKGAARTAKVITFTPAAGALVFLEHNSMNRDWDAPSTVEIIRQINNGDYKYNGQGAIFYTTGILGDKQHRIAAHALAGLPLETPVSFGIDPDAAPTIDCGGCGLRDGAAASKIVYDIKDPGVKQTVLRNASRYFFGIDKDPSFKIRSVPEMSRALNDNNEMLTEAVELGQQSRENITRPQFKQADAATLAYIFLRAGMPREKVIMHLSRFQIGALRMGENDAHFAAIKVIADTRTKVAKGKEKVEKLPPLKEWVMVVAAVKAAEAGNVPTAQQLRAAVQRGKRFPDPRSEPIEDLGEEPTSQVVSFFPPQPGVGISPASLAE